MLLKQRRTYHLLLESCTYIETWKQAAIQNLAWQKIPEGNGNDDDDDDDARVEHDLEAKVQGEDDASEE